MKKRVLSFLLATVLILSLLPTGAIQGTVHAAETVAYAVEGGNIYFDPSTGAITDCDETITFAVIPEKINGISVTTIGDHVFWFCHRLTGVTIPNSVTTIGDRAFYGCDSLTGVTIPDSVTTIGDDVFYSCDSLTGIWVNAANKAYSSDAYGVLFNKDKTTLILCPDGYSGKYTIPDSVTTISDEAFYGCSSLTGVTIPDSVTTIGDYAFTNCHSLTGVTIPDSVTTIGDGAFINCSSLTGIWVNAANKVYSSDAYGFLFSKDKTTLILCPGDYSGKYTIPHSVTSIGDRAFINCHSLTGVTIPDSVTSIGNRAFYSCYSLTGVTIPDSVTVISDEAFYSCSRLTNVTIPDSVTTIGQEAFSWCDSLTSVMIPDSVTTIGDRAFSHCDSLTGIWVNAANKVYSSDACGVLFSKDKTTLNQFPGGYSGKYTIPDSVTIIGDLAFFICENLTGINIGDSVTTIGNQAFTYCRSLTSVTIPDSVTTIDYRAFGECDSLTSVTILNPNCSIYDTRNTLGVRGTTVIYGYSGSTAESYAEKYGYDFEPLQKVFYENTYKADIWLNLRSGNEVTMESEVIDSVLALPSLSTEMSETLDADKKFQNSLAGWQGMQVIFDPVSAVDDIYLSQEGIYETLILDFLKQCTEKDEEIANNIILQSVDALGTGAKEATKYKKVVDNIATMVDAPVNALLETLKTYKFDPKDSTFVNFYASLNNTNDTMKTMWTDNKFVDNVAIIADVATNISEFYQKLTAYMLVYDMSQEMVTLLTEMMRQTKNFYFRCALADVINAVGNADYISIICTLDLAQDTAISFMGPCFREITKAIPVYNTLSLGYQAGKAFADLALNTSNLIDSYYLLDATRNFVAANKGAITALENRYKASGTEGDAAAYVLAVESYCHIMGLDFEAGIQFVKSSTEDGYFNWKKNVECSIIAFVLGQEYSTSYDNLVEIRDGLQEDLAIIFDHLQHSWKYMPGYLKTDYPEIYPLYLAEDFSQKIYTPSILSTRINRAGESEITWKMPGSYTDTSGVSHTLYGSLIMDGGEITEKVGGETQTVTVASTLERTTTVLYNDEKFTVFPKEYSVRGYANTSSGKVYTNSATKSVVSPCKPVTLKITKENDNLMIGIYDPTDTYYENIKYHVLRKVSGTDSYEEILTLDREFLLGGRTTYLRDLTAQAGISYTYKVISEMTFENGQKLSSTSTNELGFIFTPKAQFNTLTVRSIMNSPAKKSSTAATKGIELSWEGTSQADGYQIYRKTGYGTNFLMIGDVGAEVSKYLDTTAKAGTSYEYFLVPYTRIGEEVSFNASGSCAGELAIDDTIAFGHSLNLASDISINFVVEASQLETYSDHYLVAEIPVYTGNELTKTETVTIRPVLNGSYYYYTLSDLTAVHMGNVINAQLHMEKDGQSYLSKVDTYSIARYAFTQMDKTNIPLAVRILCADLLRYGKEAQVYKNYRTDALVDSAMTEEQKAYLSDAEAITFNNVNETLADLENPIITWAGKSLSLDSKVGVKYIFSLGTYTGKTEELTLRVNYVNYNGQPTEVILKNPELYNKDYGFYAFTLDSLLASELRSVIDVAVYHGDIRLSQTIRYSPDTYGNNKTGQLLILCKALIAYSDTAKAYFAK